MSYISLPNLRAETDAILAHQNASSEADLKGILDHAAESQLRTVPMMTQALSIREKILRDLTDPSQEALKEKTLRTVDSLFRYLNTRGQLSSTLWVEARSKVFGELYAVSPSLAYTLSHQLTNEPELASLFLAKVWTPQAGESDETNLQQLKQAESIANMTEAQLKYLEDSLPIKMLIAPNLPKLKAEISEMEQTLVSLETLPFSLPRTAGAAKKQFATDLHALRCIYQELEEIYDSSAMKETSSLGIRGKLVLSSRGVEYLIAKSDSSLRELKNFAEELQELSKQSQPIDSFKT